MDLEKTYINKDLAIPDEEYNKSAINDFVGEDLAEQLEWAMLLIQQQFKQMGFADYLPMVTRNHFDKCYLISASMKEEDNDIRYFKPFTDLQATPEIFPLINVKYFNIHMGINLSKIQEIDFAGKRHLKINRKYAYKISRAFYQKHTESFYGIQKGYEVNPSFFELDFLAKPKIELCDIPKPFSLHPGYTQVPEPMTQDKVTELADVMKLISMAYQIAMSMYYEWCIYIKEYDNIGIILPISPSILSEIYKTSLLKFDSKKRMLHFVRDHYRRKVADPNEDYSIFVQKYLRGEYKFDYNGFKTEIIPPRYDLNRVKTKKKFINAIG